MKEPKLTKSQIIGKAYELYAHEVLAIFLHYNICIDDAEDLMQEVFVKVLGVDVICESTLKGLVMTAAFNIRKDYFRKRAFRRGVLENIQTEVVDNYNNESTIIANDILRVETMIVNKYLNEVNSKVYMLSRYQEKNAVEIADEMGLGLRSVESRLYYTRKIMRKKLACAL